MERRIIAIKNFRVEIDLSPVEDAAEHQKSNDIAEYSDQLAGAEAVFENGDYSLNVILQIPWYTITPKFRDHLTDKWEDFGYVRDLVLRMTPEKGKRLECLINDVQREGESSPVHYADMETYATDSKNKIFTVTLEQSKFLCTLIKNYD